MTSNRQVIFGVFLVVAVTAFAAASAAASGHHWISNHTLVSIAHSQTLAAGQHADDVIGVLGDSTVAGDVSRDAVAVLGDLQITGRVDGDVVSVLGNISINSRVGGDVVAVFGNVELGPDAEVVGELNAVGGKVIHSPTDASPDVSANRGIDFTTLRVWVTECLLEGRLLAFDSRLTWAWVFALVSLGFCVLTAFLWRDAINRYTRILHDHPAESLVAGFLAGLATPVILVFLCITVIGILAIPFAGIALLLVASFGKVVVMAWIGGRVLRPSTDGLLPHPALTVLVGGLILTALYAIPLLGMFTFQATGIVGMGVALYGLWLVQRHPIDARASTAAIPAADNPTINPRAGFWIRMGALFIDVVVVGITVGLVFDSDKTHLLLLAIYGAVTWKLKGATLGDLIFHLQVVRLDGRPLDWPTAVIRALGCFLSLFVVFLGFIWIAVDSERQAWHDKIAGTVVVRLPTGASLV